MWKQVVSACRPISHNQRSHTTPFIRMSYEGDGPQSYSQMVIATAKRELNASHLKCSTEAISPRGDNYNDYCTDTGTRAIVVPYVTIHSLRLRTVFWAYQENSYPFSQIGSMIILWLKGAISVFDFLFLGLLIYFRQGEKVWARGCERAKWLVSRCGT